MEYVIVAIKIFIFLSICNVWFIRFNKPTTWRAEGASSMKEEFSRYGLAESMVYVVGALKVLSALALVISIWMPVLTTPAASLMAFLMIGAIAMHIKVSDPLRKSFPAFSFLILSLVLIAYSEGFI